jgi:alkylglycerol monooxygenase
MLGGLDLAQAIAIVVFTLLIGIEWLVDGARARRRGRPSGFPFADSLTNVSLGIGSVLFGGLTVLQGVDVHRYLDAHCALVTLPEASGPVWIGVMIAVDFCFYWSHRAMHRVNLFWAIHATHHQSEQFNFLVALRIAWMSVFFSWIFYLPLALLGVTLEMVVLARAISTLYQFLLHTQLVDKLGPLELVLNTPSHHRVHHGTDARYLDRNHGGILIVWDRLFGTFAAEDGEPTYGTVQPFPGNSPIWSNAIEWARLLRMTRQTRRLRDKLQLWLRPPEWRPADLAAAAVAVAPAGLAAATAARRPAARAAVPRPIAVYLAIQFVLVLGTAQLSLFYSDRVDTAAAVLLTAEIVLALVVWGALLDGRRWGFPLEWVRLGSLAALTVAWGLAAGPLAIAAPLGALAGFGAWSVRLAALPRSAAAGIAPRDSSLG